MFYVNKKIVKNKPVIKKKRTLFQKMFDTW